MENETPGVLCRGDDAWRHRRDELLDEAIRMLTDAARLTQPVLHRVSAGGWEPHPTRTEPADWAEFVTYALAGAVANVGGIEIALAGRPGSWEADGVRHLLTSTVGPDEEYMWEHRTESVRIVLDPDLGWLEDLYTESQDAIGKLEAAVAAKFDPNPHQWIYRRTGADSQEFVCDDRDAPAWPEALARFKDDLAALGEPREFIDAMPAGFSLEVWVSRSDEDRAEIVRLVDLEREATVPYQRMFQRLEEQWQADRADYVDRLKASIRAEAARRYPGLTVEFPEIPAGGSTAVEYPFGSPEQQLLDHALENTPLPGSGLARKDYPIVDQIENVERAAGRLPHLRLDGVEAS